MDTARKPVDEDTQQHEALVPELDAKILEGIEPPFDQGYDPYNRGFRRSAAAD